MCWLLVIVLVVALLLVLLLSVCGKKSIDKFGGDEPVNVVVFGTTTCPWCKKAKELLRSHNIKAKIVDMDVSPDGAKIRDWLRDKYNATTVPQVFVNDQLIGGFKDLEQFLSRS